VDGRYKPNENNAGRRRAAFIVTEAPKWAEVAKSSGLKLE
jgi:hypothetical protein